MHYISKISDYLKISSDDEVKHFVVINFSEYFNSTREKLYSKLSEKQNFIKVVELLYIFLTTPDEVEKYVDMIQSSYSDNCISHFDIKILNLFDPELQLNNTKPMIRNKLKELLSELKKFKAETVYEKKGS